MVAGAVPPATDAVARLMERIEHDGAFARSFPRSRPVTPSRSYVWSSLVVMAMLAIVWLGVRVAGPQRRVAEYSAAPGQQLLVRLNDGTRIQLAPRAHIRVHGEGNEARIVDLSGEAMFDVQTSHQRPLVIRTGAIVTRVLGTTFSVRCTPDHHVWVSVREGRVSTGNSRAAVVVRSGTTADVTDSTATLAVTQDVPQYTDWEDGQLVFNRVPVSTVLSAVGEWYGYQFKVADSTLVKQNVTVRFKISDPAEMMVLLKDMLDVDLRFDGKVVTLVRHVEHRVVPEKAPSGHQRFTPTAEIGK